MPHRRMCVPVNVQYYYSSRRDATRHRRFNFPNMDLTAQQDHRTPRRKYRCGRLSDIYNTTFIGQPLHPIVQGTNIHRAISDSVAYQQTPLKNAIFFSMLQVSAASRSASCENMPELAAYQLSTRIRSIRRLNLLVDTSDGIHRKGKIRM
jgi:hypothetical protein